MKGDKFYTNEELIKGVYNKDSQVLEHIIHKAYPTVKRMVLSNSGNKLDADEVFQEALIVLFRKIREGDFTLKSSVTTYLFSVAKHKWLHELRRLKPTEDISFAYEVEDELEADTNYLIFKNERLKLFREKFDELSKDCKKVLRMFLMKVPLAEITKIMGYSSEQVARNRRFKCKEALVKSIQQTDKFKELSYENNP